MTKNVLILCTGNSCRSILAESIFNRKAIGRFTCYSAGSKPAGRVNPNAIALLQEKGHDTAGLRSKSWDEFSGPAAPMLDFVITVCGKAAGETCPIWFGAPVSAHWGIADPAEVTGTSEVVRAAFSEAYQLLETRIDAFLALPIETMDNKDLAVSLKAIGEMKGAA